MIVKVICVPMLFLLLFSSEVFPKEWNGITPCVSSRTDAERVLGKDSIPHEGPYGTYLFHGDRVYIYYFRTGNSSNSDIVRKIDIYLETPVLLSKYARNLPAFATRFRKIEMDPKITHLRYLANYFSAAEGFEIDAQKNDDDEEIITHFGYYGIESDCSKLLREAPDRKPEGARKNGDG